MAQQLDDSQQRVVDLSNGHFLVLAPPGCGKTHLLTERIRRSHARGVDYADMLCLTFTNRAAREMQRRSQQLVEAPAGSNPLFIGNIHRFCSKFLFEEGIVTANASVIDDDEAMSIIADCTGENEDHVLNNAMRVKEYKRVIFLSHLIEQKEHNHPAGLYMHPEVEADMAKDSYEDYARRYARYKHDNNLLDFEDLLIYTYEAYREDAMRGADRQLRRYSWIQIDEVQDLNAMQLAIVDQLTQDDDATVMYLGDEQQAIFSFMGAKVETLDQLRLRCKGQVYHLTQNHRSPAYLLKVLNDYAEYELKIDPQLLPKPCNMGTDESEPLSSRLHIIHSGSVEAEVRDVARQAMSLTASNPEETIAVIVNANDDAERISIEMNRMKLSHFKVSGRDMFDSRDMKLLLAHLSVMSNERNFIAWARLMKGLRVFDSNPLARRFLRKLRQLAISPADFLDYADSTEVNELVKAYDSSEMVVFDTETTGVNPLEDHVIEIAAMRVRQGEIVGEPLDLYIRTDREIPEMLGTIPNPMCRIYRKKEETGELLNIDEAVARFLEYVDNRPVVGHNVMFDMQMVAHAITDKHQRQQWRSIKAFDTLKLMHLIEPRLHSYKLDSLLKQYQLEGKNSHLAIDDVEATVNLLALCHAMSKEKIGEQMAFISHPKVMPFANKLRAAYQELYNRTKSIMYAENNNAQPALIAEINNIYDYLLGNSYINKIERLHYFTDYLLHDMMGNAQTNATLAMQLSDYLMEINTMKESDFCNSRSINEKVYVSTIHKAKGLEFDNVIVFDAVAGRFPNYYNTSARYDEEDARKFYVALSRAKRRLFVAYSMQSRDRYGGIHNRELTPFMNSILKHFS